MQGMEGYIAQIIFFAGNFAPRNWAFCQNQILSIAQNTALFSLLGTTYGGNGQTTFALPDARGRAFVGTGTGPGLPNVVLGELAGSPSATLTVNNLPAHNHTFTDANSVLKATDTKATSQVPSAGASLGRTSDSSPAGALPRIYVPSGSAPGNSFDLAGVTAKGTIGNTGSSQAFSVQNPYIGMNAVICMFGIFPSRN
jgi:microcystin-dependent protein